MVATPDPKYHTEGDISHPRIARIAGIGLLVLILFFRRIRRTSRQPGGGAPSPLSAAERKRLDALLKEEAS